MVFELNSLYVLGVLCDIFIVGLLHQKY